MFFSEGVENLIKPNELSEDHFLLTLHNNVVGRIVKYAQSVHFENDVEGPSLSDHVRQSLTRGLKKI